MNKDNEQEIILENPDPQTLTLVSKETTTKPSNARQDVDTLESYIISNVKDPNIVPYEDVKKYKYVQKRVSNTGFANINNLHTMPIVQDSQISAWDRHIFTHQNITAFNSLETFHEKVQFIVNIIMDYDLLNQVLKFDETDSINVFRLLSEEELFESLKTSFQKKCSQSKETTKKKEPNNTNDNKISAKGKVPHSTKDNSNPRTTKQKSKKKKSRAKHTVKDNAPKELKKGIENEENTSIQTNPTKLPPKYTSSMDSSHAINSYLSFNKLYPEEVKKDEWMEEVLRKKGTKSLFEDYNDEMYKNERSHSLYSCIHPCFEDYQLRVYNGSHRIEYDKNEIPTIHATSLLNIKIPSPTNCHCKTFFVIFNSRIVHGGSRTIRPALLSSHFQLNFRLFNFVMQSYNGTRKKIGLGSENESDFTNLNGKTDYIDRSSFNICNSDDCEHCIDLLKKKGSKTHSKEMTVDVKEEYELKRVHWKDKVMKDSKGINRPKSYVCGDLDEHGWEVHEGINYMKDAKKYKFLRFHLEQLQIKGGSQWNTIKQSAGRQFIKLTEHVNAERRQTWLSRRFLTDVCFPDLSSIITKIHGFEGHDMQGHLLMANRRVSQDQEPHRDYNKPTQDKRKRVEHGTPTRKMRKVTNHELPPSDSSKATASRSSRRLKTQPNFYYDK